MLKTPWGEAEKLEIKLEINSMRSEGKYYGYAVLKDYGIKRKLVLLKGWQELRFKEKRKGKRGVNEEKLEANISRAKGRITELAMCNDWDYWVTLTIRKERYDLENWRKKLGRYLRSLRQEGREIKYLLVPEKHKDGAWHMHGLITGLEELDLEINENGYLDWPGYKKRFGYISMSKIRNKQKVSSYITKYLTKDVARNVTKLGKRMFYASQGLKSAEIVKKGSFYDVLGKEGYENQWAKIYWLEEEEKEKVEKLFFE